MMRDDSEGVVGRGADLPFVAQRIGLHFLRHALLEEDAQFLLVIDLEDLLAASRWIRNVQLHPPTTQRAYGHRRDTGERARTATFTPNKMNAQIARPRSLSGIRYQG